MTNNQMRSLENQLRGFSELLTKTDGNQVFNACLTLRILYAEAKYLLEFKLNKK